ncbi:cytochrome P450 [Fusarium albosuccineum]|uniref:Cytochrome P450 n=1 Tax=Fusarium albosuccineum TaxID=1237068 RepID=A0A8H4L8A6_9HYPO|nr:cytochrome P450 [Fusarium albosuccineum]
METLLGYISWKSIATFITIYVVDLALYRLTFHRLARFPGPRLAAATRYYEGYYDVWKGGQYTFKIGRLHKEYGPIIRISPHELHVSDPEFFEQLYNHYGRWDKYGWATDAMGVRGSALHESDHFIHKARRQALNPFFSKARVTAHLDKMRYQVDKLCIELVELVKTGETFNLGAAVHAVAHDIATDFTIGKTYNRLDRKAFDSHNVSAVESIGARWRLSKFVRWVNPLLMALPIDWVMKIADNDLKAFLRHVKRALNDTQDLVEAVEAKSDGPRTLIHDILNSKLPASEKTFERVFVEMAVVSGAGFETMASVLRIILFHVFNNLEILSRLRGELASANEDSTDELELKVLEQLPYLNAVINEGLRLSPAVASRMARIAPDRDIWYKDWCIPAGTPVGMTAILMHTDEESFSNPKEFKPDRWMDPLEQKKGFKAFVPFSKGTRICLGMHLAWAELYLVISTLVQRFDFHFPEAKAEDFEPVADHFAVGTRGKGVLKATVSLRRE